MAQVKLLKIDSDGLPVEFTSSADEITLTSFMVEGSGQLLSALGLDLANTDAYNIANLIFDDPSTGTINQTSGALIVDDILGKDRSNLMASGSDIRFGTVTDDSDELDAFKLPEINGLPTAAPANAGEGYLVWRNDAESVYVWDGTTWNDLNTVSAVDISNQYVAEVAINARDVVYISSADNVSPASASASISAQAIGIAIAAASITDPVIVRKVGIVPGFSGLTPGSRYYLDTVAGGITSTIPTGSGHTIIQIGFAKSATELDLQIQFLSRRS